MKNKNDNYYGIRFNDDIPVIDKLNKYNKKIEIKFLGKAYLVERKDDKIIKTEIKNYYMLDKEGDYEIEFINNSNELYNLQVRIEKSYLFFIILILFGILFLVISMFPINNETLIAKFVKLIDLSVLSVDIEENERYVFDVEFKNIISSDIELPSTINVKNVAKDKIAPGTNGEFSIIISTKNSTVDMKYSVSFEDVTREKPQNLLFKIKGTNKEYSSLQELENYLKGVAKKQTQTEYVIEWRWPYEINNTQDITDTNDGIKLNNYKFRIHVYGEEDFNEK